MGEARSTRACCRRRVEERGQRNLARPQAPAWSGGRWLVEVHNEALRERRQRELVERSKRVARWLKVGGNHTLSGRLEEPVGRLLHFEFGTRKCKRNKTPSAAAKAFEAGTA